MTLRQKAVSRISIPAKSKLVETNEKIAEKVMGTYQKIEDAFVDRYLTKDGETVEEAKKRLRQENEQTN